MIVKLAGSDVRNFVTDVIKDEAVNFVKAETMIPNWESLIVAGVGRGYGLIRDGKRVGFLLGLITDDLLSGEKQAFEYLWIVMPECRAGAGAIGLLKQFEADARNEGCKQIHCGARVSFKPKEFRRLYARLGYAPFSESFVKNL